jgi:hypothetical protein
MRRGEQGDSHPMINEGEGQGQFPSRVQVRWFLSQSMVNLRWNIFSESQIFPNLACLSSIWEPSVSKSVNLGWLSTYMNQFSCLSSVENDLFLWGCCEMLVKWLKGGYGAGCFTKIGFSLSLSQPLSLSLLTFLLFFFFFLLCSPGRPQTPDSPGSASPVLGLQRNISFNQI